MSDSQPPTIVDPARSRLALVAWERQVVGAQSAVGLVGDDIARSWERSSSAQVDPGMLSAPLLADESTLAARRQLEWVELAEQQLAPHVEAIRESGHVLTLFGADGLMLSSAGAAGTLELLHDIHFMPGAVWDERVVGTNGPGTALALHRPVHVVGAEHYCAAWHAWHCAAVPLFDPRSRRLLGALDISGRREQASGYALGMARALGRLVEQSLLLRAEEQRARLLEQFRVLVARYPADTILAADSEGAVVAAHPLPASSVALSELKRRAGTSVVTVRSGEATVGACYIHRRDALVPSSRPKPRVRPKAGALRYRLADLTGQHPLLEDARRLVRIASTNQLPVLLLGESGVGKEVAAQAVHAEGPRAEGPFVAVNCGAIPKELVESELFGYVGGAFSGARRQGGRGKLEAAGGGTLFLDEIGELPLTTQVVLLRVLSEQQFTPVGATEPRATDARIIAATNRDLQAEVAAGRFRADLFYRLNVISIVLPPLRLRQMDLPDLCERMLALAAEETGRVVTLHPDVMAAFARYSWPGNVRELENLLKRLSAVSRTEVVELSDLPREVAQHASSTFEELAPVQEDAHKLKLLSVISGARTMAEAAKRLGVTRSTLYRQLERLGLRPGRGVRQA